jgi:hypothetical protein
VNTPRWYRGTPARLALFIAALGAIGGGAAAVGSALPSSAGATSAMSDEAMHDAPRGLTASAAGYTLAPVRSTLAAGGDMLRLRILDERGRAVHDFDLEGGVRLHLIVVRRDLAGYRHVHPRLRRDGSWSVPLRLTQPGAYRVFADFERDGRKIVLGHDLFVAGAMTPRPLSAPVGSVRTGGFEVSLDAPPLRAGRDAELEFAVRRGGALVERFERYVGMRGHLVALRAGDLPYTHVHEVEGEAERGRLRFAAELDEPGTYRLFLQFKIDGRVVTAPFTVEVGA